MTRLLLVAAGVEPLRPVQGPPLRAVLIDGERITWVGAGPAAAPPADAAVDLGSAWITPAFVDAHVHATDTGLAQTGVELDGCESLTEALHRLRRHAAASDASVLLGGGWDETVWAEQRPPTAAEVGTAAPARTVVLSRVDKHSCVVDPATLRRLPLAELDGVQRDDEGEPTGWLKEQAAQAALRDVLARLPSAALHQARLAACRSAAALGIASVHEMAHPGLSGFDDARAWATGQWPIEVLVWWAELSVEAAVRHDLRLGGDVFLDGSIGSHTAALEQSYRDAGGHGVLFHDDDEVAEFFVEATAAGRGAGVHAIGGRAIAQAVNAIEAAAAVHGAPAVRACRHRIEHVELPARDVPGRMAALGVVASMQPAFDARWGGDEGLYARRLGVPAARTSNPFGTFAAAGVPLAFGSDSTVTPLAPWAAVNAAVAHRGGHGVTRRTALAAHTLGGRFAAGQDDVGPLLPGLRADLAIWDSDPLAAMAAPKCLATIVAGRVIHGALREA